MSSVSKLNPDEAMSAVKKIRDLPELRKIAQENNVKVSLKDKRRDIVENILEVMEKSADLAERKAVANAKTLETKTFVNRAKPVVEAEVPEDENTGSE